MNDQLLETLPCEDDCRRALMPWRNHAGVRVDWPLSEADALRLVREGGEFDATPAVLARCESMGWFTPPESGEYSARDVLLLASILDAMRFWRPSPSVHDAKRGPNGVAVSMAIQSGTVKDIVATLAEGGMDLRRALLMMCEQETRMGRELMLWTVMAFLHHRGVSL